MDGHRHKPGRRRRRKSRNEPRTNAAPAPVLIVARRPDAPSLARTHGRLVAASAAPARDVLVDSAPAPSAPRRPEPARAEEPQKRAARIVQLPNGELDETEQQRKRLLRRLMQSEGRGAISRAADEYLTSGFELPNDQEVHLQLLEHFDEERARTSLEAMTQLLSTEPPIKKPILERRLRRLEENADEGQTRTMAAALLRSLRG